jgi:hypothetical protein
MKILRFCVHLLLCCLLYVSWTYVNNGWLAVAAALGGVLGVYYDLYAPFAAKTLLKGC